MEMEVASSAPDFPRPDAFVSPLPHNDQNLNIRDPKTKANETAATAERPNSNRTRTKQTKTNETTETAERPKPTPSANKTN